VAQLGRILRANSELRASYIPVVVAALSDEHDYVRSRAGDILVDLEADAIPPLLALATSGWRDAPLPVVSLLLPDVEADARLGLYSAAVRALTALSEPTVMTPSQREEFIRDLRETLDDNATAARGLVGLADVLGEFVAEGEPIIESTAGPTAYVGDVGEALEESPLRGNALLALAQLGRPGVDALLPYLEAPDAALRAATAAVLSTTGSVAAAERIAALCPRETDPESLTAMIVALAALDASAFAAQVEALLATADGRPDVLEAIAVALNVALEGGLPATAAMGAAALAGIARSDRLADELRREAVAALGRLAPAGVEVTLRDIMLDEHAAPMIRKAAARALGSMGARAEMALGAMEEMLLIRREDPDDFLRRLRKRHGTERQLNAAWGGLGWQAGYESLREVKVIPGLLRGEVARAYAALRGADANSLLADVLRDDQSASVRAAAASRLHGAATHTGALVRALRKDDSGSVRAAAAESLGSVGSARALKALRRAVRRDDYEQARVLAARGLGAQGGASEARGLAELLFADDEDEDTHTTATLADEITDALVALGDVATDVVVDGMDHADPDVRQAVARVLARSDDTKARARLRRALVDDASPRVRATVAAALGDRGSEDDAAALISVMSDPSEWDGVRVQAATSLGRIDSSVSEGVLRAQLGAARPQLRAAAASALGELRASGTVDDVAALVLDPDEPIATRVAATRALGKLGSGAARPLVTLAETDRGIVRAAAVRSLTTVDAPDAEAALRAIAASPFETAALRSLAMLGRGRTTQRARGSSAAR